LSYICVPVIKNGELSGIFFLTQTEPRAWTTAELEMAEEIAEQTWSAVARAVAEERLRESEERFRSLVTATSDVFYKMSADWTVMYRLEGRDLLVNTDAPNDAWIKTYIPESERSKVISAFEKAIASKQIFELEHQVFGATGKLSWVYSRAVPKLNSEGEIVEWFGAASDITLRKEAEVQLKDFALMLEQQVEERTYDLNRSTRELEKNLAILEQAEEIAQMGSWEYNLTSGSFNWSEGMYRLFDLPQGLLVKPEIYLDFALEEDRPVARRIIKNLKKGQDSFEETMQIHRGDNTRLLKIKSSVVKDENGRPEKVIGVDLDITDIREAENKVAESRRLLEQTAMTSPDAITIYDLQKKEPVYLNNCLSEWTGRTLDELVEMGIEGRLRLIHPDDRLPLLHFNEMIALAKDGDVLRLEYRIKTTNDDFRWIRNRSKVFQRDAADKVTHILSILQDVSEEKAAERLLKNLNTSLEQQNKELEAKNDEITSFAFVASHDLKEPIRKIHTFSDWLLQTEENLSEHGVQNLTRLHNAVKRLDTLVDDIVALTKVHIEKEDLRDVNLNVVLNRAKQEMNESLERSGASIVAEDLPIVRGVENHLVYLFKNLISNSIKFQPEHNKAVIEIKAVKIDSLLKLTFTDNGIGFPPEYNKRIFQMFRRLHGKTEYEGTGMGLAICKRIMERHGGSITAEGTPEKGAVFTCWFPL
ncbi:MAG: PAS domain S-box protein, partial [Chitinophagaceae bacterium]